MSPRCRRDGYKNGRLPRHPEELSSKHFILLLFFDRLPPISDQPNTLVAPICIGPHLDNMGDDNEEQSTWDAICEGAQQGWDDFWEDPGETPCLIICLI
jgi:hypothetical protein